MHVNLCPMRHGRATKLPGFRLPGLRRRASILASQASPHGEVARSRVLVTPDVHIYMHSYDGFRIRDLHEEGPGRGI